MHSAAALSFHRRACGPATVRFSRKRCGISAGYRNNRIGGIVVPVALDIPVYADRCLSVFGAPRLYRNVRLAEFGRTVLHAAGW